MVTLVDYWYFRYIRNIKIYIYIHIDGFHKVRGVTVPSRGPSEEPLKEAHFISRFRIAITLYV